MVNRIWPTAVAGKADSVSSVSASACHIGGPNSVNPGQILLVYGSHSWQSILDLCLSLLFPHMPLFQDQGIKYLMNYWIEISTRALKLCLTLWHLSERLDPVRPLGWAQRGLPRLETLPRWDVHSNPAVFQLPCHLPGRIRRILQSTCSSIRQVVTRISRGNIV